VKREYRVHWTSFKSPNKHRTSSWYSDSTLSDKEARLEIVRAYNEDGKRVIRIYPMEKQSV
jgi:hypothetical protein